VSLFIARARTSVGAALLLGPAAIGVYCFSELGESLIEMPAEW